jgi:hypothetical protein
VEQPGRAGKGGQQVGAQPVAHRGPVTTKSLPARLACRSVTVARLSGIKGRSRARSVRRTQPVTWQHFGGSPDQVSVSAAAVRAIFVPGP